MSKEPENFDELRKLLSLKRHEQPPPGFFRDLPGQIMTRIEREEAAKIGWWARLKEAFELRPALSVGYAGALCGLLIAGVYLGGQSAPDGGGQLVVDDAGLSEVNNPFNVSTGELSQAPVGIFDPQIAPDVQRVGFQTNTSSLAQ